MGIQDVYRQLKEMNPLGRTQLSRLKMVAKAPAVRIPGLPRPLTPANKMNVDKIRQMPRMQKVKPMPMPRKMPR
jgi:hypothetical protein